MQEKYNNYFKKVLLNGITQKTNKEKIFTEKKYEEHNIYNLDYYYEVNYLKFLVRI